MGTSKKPSPEATISPGALIAGSLIVAVWLLAFAVGYWGGRDIGALIFS